MQLQKSFLIKAFAYPIYLKNKTPGLYSPGVCICKKTAFLAANGFNSRKVFAFNVFK